MKAFCTLLLAAVAVAAPAPASPFARRDGLAPLFTAKEGAKTTGGYIVVLNDEVEDVEGLFGTLALPTAFDSLLGGLVKGFSGMFDDVSLALIRAHPQVEYVEADGIMYALETQSGASYGLGISSQSGPLSAAQQTTYYYDQPAGSGVTVYIIDTGINAGHSDFGGRAQALRSFVGGTANDDNGHGTHCAGTIGGSTYGIAKGVTLKGIKVLGSDGSGSTSGIVQAIDYAVSVCPGKCVISMSLGGGYSPSLNSAVARATAAGIPTAVAAGNEDQDACNVSPASEPSAITVAALDSSYTRASFSNYGSCVDIFGPGVAIKSAWIGSSTATNTISGTSMATPHIAGILAYLLAEGYSQSALFSFAQSGVSDTQGSPNRIGNNGYFF